MIVAAPYSGKKVGSSYLGRGGLYSVEQHKERVNFLDFNLAIDDLGCLIPVL